ncbi:11687_t:CDS:2 [Scutellospora calospora]|uniref:11687_t:CDS:1 n=1 Tax=Scutellospora calospora TaxID=85575 RepID=A0ACA9K8J2_9GLOM|nr:11687_t:CDS:2 [Scutellospora calospora]
MTSSKKSVGVQFALNITPGMGILNSSYEHSFYDELLSMNPPPYKLTIKVDELIAPANNSRRSTQHRRNPIAFAPPRPPNAFVLFRKDYFAKYKSNEQKINNTNISRLASIEWKAQPPSVRYYFYILFEAAKEKHLLETERSWNSNNENFQIVDSNFSEYLNIPVINNEMNSENNTYNFDNNYPGSNDPIPGSNNPIPVHLNPTRIQMFPFQNRDIRVEVYTLVLLAKNTNASLLCFSCLHKELKNLNVLFKIIKAIKFLDITEDANKI